MIIGTRWCYGIHDPKGRVRKPYLPALPVTGRPYGISVQSQRYLTQQIDSAVYRVRSGQSGYQRRLTLFPHNAQPPPRPKGPRRRCCLALYWEQLTAPRSTWWCEPSGMCSCSRCRTRRRSEPARCRHRSWRPCVKKCSFSCFAFLVFGCCRCHNRIAYYRSWTGLLYQIPAGLVKHFEHALPK